MIRLKPVRSFLFMTAVMPMSFPALPEPYLPYLLFWENLAVLYTAIDINVAEDEEMDEEFKTLCVEPTMDIAKAYLSFIPGNPPASLFSNGSTSPSIDAIVICGIDSDLLITANQHALMSDEKAIQKGVRILKQITGIENIIMAAPEHLMQNAGVSAPG